MAGGNIPSQLAPIFQQAGAKYNIPANVLAGIASVETNLGANRSTSSAGAVGLMQFEPGTAQSVGINPLDDRQAIFGAAKLLTQYGYHQDPFRAIGAYNGGPGNPQAGYARQVLSEAQRLAGQIRGASGTNLSAVPGQGTTSSAFDQAGFNQAQQKYNTLTAFKAANRSNPFDVGPKVAGLSGGDPVLAMLRPQQPNPADFMTAHTSLQGLAGTQLAQHPGGNVSGYVNPIPGANIGRTDMGVDANLPAGHPIVALGDSKVVAIQPNWYKGQPYVEMQLTSGPQAGKTWYVAEAINPLVKPGDTVRAGQRIGTYNPNGTGLELGWGAPGGRTLAQATTGYTEGQQTPAGKSFRNFLMGLR